MALSTMQNPFGADWPLGFIAVANNGTPVNIMSRVDANNVNAPGSTANSSSAEYTPTCHKIRFQGYKPGSSNNGMIINTGLVYVLAALGPGNGNSGGPQNRTDSGAIVAVIPVGAEITLPALEYDGPTISPYRYRLDCDVDGEGALVTLIGCGRG